ncbi:MAG: glutamyl-tRNA reductase [Gemmatimonadota bacterium]|nr:glutamyl-tRNA reductase [Gemmatimonadota bacterium]
MSPRAPRLVVVGLSHRSAPIEVRERYELSGGRRREFIDRVLSGDTIDECVVLSTCNRTECYAVGSDPGAVTRVLRRELERTAGERPAAAGHGEVDRAASGPDGAHIFEHAGFDVVRHLYRVTAGLDSLVIGEAQIQGQVSSAYHRSEEHAVGPALHRLFQSALAAGGRVRSNTSISAGAASIPSAAVDLARKVFGTLRDRSVMVVGTGEMGRLTVSCLRSEGVGRVFVASRHQGRAERVGRELEGIPVSRAAVWERIGAIDLVVTATDASSAFMTARRLAEVRDDGRPTVILDIAVPRNVEETVSQLPGVFLYNIDDLQRVVDQTLEARLVENEGAEAIIAYHAGKFWSWYRGRSATAAIRVLREEAHALLGAELAPMLERGPRDFDRVEGLRLASEALLNKILHGPTRALRRLAEESGFDDELRDAIERRPRSVGRSAPSRIADEGPG